LRPQDALLFLQVKLPYQLRRCKSRSLGGQHARDPSEHPQVTQLLYINKFEKYYPRRPCLVTEHSP
jgi:hypothetical protein